MPQPGSHACMNARTHAQTDGHSQNILPPQPVGWVAEAQKPKNRSNWEIHDRPESPESQYGKYTDQSNSQSGEVSAWSVWRLTISFSTLDLQMWES